jgi:branched-chain amino acid transport system permease protein
MGQYLVVGLVLAGVYALASLGLLTTYLASGILDFSYGAVAFFVARVYYFLHSQQHWGIPAAALVAVAVVGPAIGAVVWAVVVRQLMDRPGVVKVAATVGLFVALPGLATLLFGNQPISQAPGLAPEPVAVYHVVGVPVTLDQAVVLVAAVVVLGASGAVLRWSAAGLVVRAAVDSRTLASLLGTNPAAVTLAVWVASTTLAGLIGVLLAPIVGLDTTQFTLLVVAAFAAVVAARLRSLLRALAGAVLLGLVEGMTERFLPSSGYLATAVVPAIPFGLMVVFLVVYSLRRADPAQREARYLVEGPPRPAPAALGNVRSRRARAAALVGRSLHRTPGAVLVGAVVLALPLLLGGQWRSLVGEGMAFAVVFASYTFITGEASLISLCQVSFAGLGGVLAAELASRDHLPFLLAMVAGGLAAVPLGLLVGALSVRLGELYVALVTLGLGLLMDTMVFTLSTFSNFGSGIPLARPSFASGSLGFDYLTIAVFALVAAFLQRLRGSTVGMALAAMRASEPAARVLGIRTVRLQVGVVGIGSFVAGLGGVLYAAYAGAAPPSDFATLTGLVWLTVVVSLGLRSATAAVLAGLTFAFVPALFLDYLPSSLSQLPAVLFGLGAIGAARAPEGVVAHQAVLLRRALERRVRGGRSGAFVSSPEEAGRGAGQGVAAATGHPR